MATRLTRDPPLNPVNPADSARLSTVLWQYAADGLADLDGETVKSNHERKIEDL